MLQVPPLALAGSDLLKSPESYKRLLAAARCLETTIAGDAGK